MIGLVIFLVLLFTKIIPSSRYEKAVGLYEAGNYCEAYEIFVKLGDFNDSRTYAEEAKVQIYRDALTSYANNDFVKAQELFSSLGDY